MCIVRQNKITTTRFLNRPVIESTVKKYIKKINKLFEKCTSRR